MKIESGARKILPIIYVIDTSGSMTGPRIAAVNSAISETLEVLKEIAHKNPSAELRIGVLQFSSGAKWVTSENELVFMDDFFWSDLSAGGVTDLGAALDELYNKLSRSALLNSEVGYKAPAIIFMSDGGPTDDYKTALKKIRDNSKWYQIAAKIAIAIDKESDKNVLAEITGNSESVIEISDMVTLKKLIKVLSVTASMIGSKSRTDSDSTGDIMRVVREEMGNEVNIPTPTPTPIPAPNPIPPSDGNGGGWDTSADWD